VARAKAMESHARNNGRPRGRPNEYGAAPDPSGPEAYRLSTDGRSIERIISLRSGERARTGISIDPKEVLDTSHQALAAQFDKQYLRAAKRPRIRPRAREVRVVDLFSGCGAMSLGLWEASRAVGMRMVPVMALDSNRTALRVYEDNFPGVWAVAEPIESILDGPLDSPVSEVEKKVIERLGRVDVLIGGPPCQGHSNLNNHTRRRDPKNGLYDRMARLAELVNPLHVIIENVPAVLHDEGKVVDRTVAHLQTLGYTIDDAIVEAIAVGVPQHRRRHFLVASRERKSDIRATICGFTRDERSVQWAIGDLARASRVGPFNDTGTPSHDNRERIDYLFANKLYELPDAKRPNCHRLKSHSYKSVYGRLRANIPAQTITTGFLSMGQGRYVHPTQRRTITPHEAARLQFIPDFFDFRSVLKRTALAEMIGNAVPPKLAYVLGVELLR
jgi:DNA (cytosine-5)-methyltransferase 1